MRYFDCEICGKSTKRNSAIQKYCSDCRTIAAKEYKRKWFKNNYVSKIDKERICEYCGSKKDVKYYKRKMMLCKSHYHEMYNTGTIRKDDEKGYKNVIVYRDDCIEIHFKDGRIGYFDLEDKELVEKTYWGLDVLGYAHGKINGKLARFHRHLLNFPEEIVDHINRDKLDNRKINLRLCSPTENSRNISIAKNNKSGVTGVDKISNGKWRARIMVDRKEIHLGIYENLEEAANVRLKAELKYFGEFSPNYQKYLN